MQPTSFLWTTLRLALLAGAAVSIVGCDSAGCVLALACAGSGGSNDAPVPAPALVFDFPTDFVVPYIASTSTDDDLFVVSASSLATSVHVIRPVTGLMIDAATLTAGDWAAGVVSNMRPSQFVYALPRQWYRAGLRNGTAVTALAFGQELNEICDSSAQSSFSPGFVLPPISFPDYANPMHSWWFYETDPAGGDCTAEPTEYHGLRLDDASSTSPRGVGANVEPLRAFYSTAGAITGFVARVGSDISYFDSNFANPVLLVSNVSNVGRAGSFARTADTIYVRYKDANSVSYIDRITSNGVNQGHLFSMANATFRSGFSDDTVLYVRAGLSNGSTQLVRVPYNGSATSTIFSSPNFFFIVGVTSHAVIVDEESSGGEFLYAIEKSSGATVNTVAQATPTFLFGEPPEVVGDRIIWTAYDDPRNTGFPTTTRAGISRDDGSVVEVHNNSKWIADFVHSSTLAKAQASPSSGEVLVHDYTSADWGLTGDQGGTVAFYNFDLGTTTDNLMTVPGPALIFTPHEPVGLATYYDLGTNHADVLSFDLRVPAIGQVTNTPNADEGVPFER